MKILSLFDGMACGHIAMQNAGVEIESYDAYEIDKYAIKVASHNFPDIQQHGDVFTADFTQYEGVDFVIGGSPCTYWSIAQKNNRETEASGMGWELFSQYVRAVKEAKPKFFIYENNKSMSKQIRASIDETFGFEAVGINSALVSAQNRQRLYWVGKREPDGTYSKVPVEQPADRGILLRDILESGVVAKEKAYCLKHQAGNVRDHFKKHHTDIAYEKVAEPTRIPDYSSEKSRPISASYSHKGVGEGSLQCDAFPDNPNKQVFDYVAEPINVTDSGKSHTLKAQYFKNGVANFVTNGGFNASAVAVPVNTTVDGKARTIRASGYKDGIRNLVGNDVDRKTCVAEPIRIGTIENELQNTEHDSKQYRVYSPDGKSTTICGQGGGVGAKTGLYAAPVEPVSERKLDRLGGLYEQDTRWGIWNTNGISPTLTASMGMGGGHIPMVSESTEETGNCTVNPTCGKQIYEVRNGLITIKDKQYPIKLVDGFYIIRKLTVRECMRLQTVPEWYDFSVISDTQAYKCLGNGWTCDVITHLIKSALATETSKTEDLKSKLLALLA